MANRFWEKVVASPNGCWEWSAYTNSEGYGMFHLEGKPRLAHHVALLLDGKEIPTGLQTDHLCKNRRCVNPSHLEMVTPLENTRRGRNHNREKTHCAQGHLFDDENTYWQRPNLRICRRCHANREARRRGLRAIRQPS